LQQSTLFTLLNVLGSTGGGVDDIAVLYNGVENVAEDSNTGQRKDDVGPNGTGEGGGEGDTSQAEDDNEVATNDKRVVTAQDRTLRVRCPPAGHATAGRHLLDGAMHFIINVIESTGDERGVEEENEEREMGDNRRIMADDERCPVTDKAKGEN